MIKRSLRILTGAAFLYALVGFIIVPTTIHLALSHLSHRFLTEPLNLGAVTFNPFSLTLSLQSVTIGDNPKRPKVGFESLEIGLSWSSLRDQTINIREIALQNPVADIHLRQNGTLNLADLVKTNNTVQNNPPLEREQEDTASSQNHDLPAIQLEKLSITAGDIFFTDSANTGTAKNFSLQSRNIRITANNLQWPDYQGDITVEAQLENNTRFVSETQLTNRSNAELPIIRSTIELVNFPLNSLQPYITPYAYTNIDSGSVSTEINIQWNLSTGVQIEGNSHIQRFSLSDTRTKSPVAGWDALALTGLMFDQKKNSLVIENVSLLAPSATVAIDEQLQVNLASLAKPTTTSGSSPDKATDKSSPFHLAISHFTMEKGNLSFADRSFYPGFSAPVSNLQGEITDFDTQRLEPAILKLTGEIDKYSPVDISAQLVPSQPLSHTKVTLSFTDVELTTLTPYSSRFAGYAVRKGRMNMDLDYTIQEAQLNARNHILLSHLTLGEKVTGEDVTSLPLKMAIALLKDNNGRITVDLPISGDLDDPEFQVGPTIRMALTNFITNIVTAPFDFLASLVSGDAEKLSSVAFEAGSSALSPQHSKNLDALVQALKERPKLELEIEAFASPEADAPLIAIQEIQTALQSSYIALLHEQGQIIPEQRPIPIPNEIKIALLNNLKEEKALPVDIAENASLDERLKAIVAVWPVTTTDLRALAIQRARTLKSLFVEKGLKPARIYILDAQTDNAQIDTTSATTMISTRFKLSAN